MPARTHSPSRAREIVMPTYFSLTPDQKRFLGQACAFIDSSPPKEELDKLLTLATMLLPEPVAEMLAKRASEAHSNLSDPDPQLTRWLQ